MSRIAILTFGTRGDVQPFVALAQGLARRDHKVRITAPENFQSLIEGHGFEFRAICGDIEEIIGAPAIERAMKGGVIRNLPSLVREGRGLMEEVYRKSWEASQGADILILHPKTLLAVDCAEALHIPAMLTAFQPFTPTGAFPVCGLDLPNLGSVLNRATYSLLSLQGLFYGTMRNRLRKRLMGLGPTSRWTHPMMQGGRHMPTLYAYSEAASPRPGDWPSEAQITGYWFLDEETWAPGDELQAFLDSGEAPVYVGFGSMPWDSERNTDVVMGALKLWGGRALIGRGWGGVAPTDLPVNVYAIDHAPHNILLPLTSAVVHHGGAGTTAAGLRAGRPTLICPYSADQPFWRRRMHDIGVGPFSPNMKKLSAEELAGFLDDLVSNRSYREAAERAAERIRSETGIETAMDIIERTLS